MGQTIPADGTANTITSQPQENEVFAEAVPVSATPQIINTQWRCERYSYDEEAVQITMQSSPLASEPEYNQPRFLIEFPEHSTAYSVFFILKNEDTGESLYETWLRDIEVSQPIAIPWPEDVPSMEIGQDYRWGLAVPCSDRFRPDIPFNSGCMTQTHEGTILHTQLRQRPGAAGGSGDHFICPSANPDD